MPSPFLRFFLLYNLLNSLLLSLVPKKLRFLLPPSWYHHSHQLNNIKSNNVVDHDVSQSTTFSSCLSSPRTAKMDSVELKKVFEMFDQNEDGKISKEELSQSLKNLGIFMVDADLNQLIEKIDVNGDGCLDIDEFGELYKAIMDERCDGDESKEEDMKEAFNVFDQNGDGFITVEELRSVLESLGVKQGKTMEDCKSMISNVDVDGDGRVSFKEFQLMMKGGAFAALS